MPELAYTSHRGRKVYKTWNDETQRVSESATFSSPTQDEIQTVLDKLALTVQHDSPAPALHLEQARHKTVRRYMFFSRSKSLPDAANNIAQCSSAYAVWLVDGKPKVAPMHCHKRACPICQTVRSLKLRDRYKRALKKMHSPKHVTLTLRSSDQPLQTQIKRLVAAFHRLRRRRCWKDRTPWGLWLIEITYNSSTKQWHPHLHIIANMRYLPKEQLRAAWHNITGDSWATGIRAVKCALELELSNYLKKASSIYLAPLDPSSIDNELHRRRFVQTFGAWPIPTKDDFHYVVFVGSVPEILRKAYRGDWLATKYVQWLIQDHPGVIAATLRPPDPLRFRNPWWAIAPETP
jgi:hypothetical protein